MSNVGQPERATQRRAIRLLQTQLGYRYLGDWQYREKNRNVEPELLTAWLRQQGVGDGLIGRVLRQLTQEAALGAGQTLYEINKTVYSRLRYGAKVREEVGQQTQAISLIDWQNPDNNDFAVAEEVTLQGQRKKRPDLVIYVNGIALGVIELKSARNDIAKGIRQHIENQSKELARDFFTTVQLLLVGSDSQGVRYGTIETTEKYYLTWKEESPSYSALTDPPSARYLDAAPCDGAETLLDCTLLRLLNKARFLELIHDFIVFDMGTKKVPRHNQYFGVRAAQRHVDQREGGIIWHTQGSGKSLTMVWLAKWIREHVTDPRILIITDRTELDEQIEGVFLGVDEQIYRTTSGADLLTKLNKNQPWLICSLIHKFGSSKTDATDDYIEELQQNLPSDFRAKGELFVFVDECHRTQSGKLHAAMKNILPNATFIGFTGTPLLKKDKQTSLEIFGSYIHTYKFNEAVADGIVLDLRYEARDIDQIITSQKRIDDWFEAKTRNLTTIAKAQLKQRWGTMKQVLSSESRLQQIATDILYDMETRPRLMDKRGNAMLVCASIYQACKVYEMFEQSELKGKCAIITSYKPSRADIRQEDAGEGLTEKLRQYEIYRRMLADFFDEPEDRAMNKVEEFETKVKERFRKEPGQMRLLIVVDKLLTGFDAPSATYLYIDKKMRDHGLFQAICRVNRLDGEDKEYGYIVDYKDLFHHLEGAIDDYTGGALDGYDKEDVAGLLTNRLDKARERLEHTLEVVRAICEPVAPPRRQNDYFAYFSAVDNADTETIRANEPKRLALYKSVRALMRAYANIAPEMSEAGYSDAQFMAIKAEVTQYHKLMEEIQHHSGDYVDMKAHEPAMRRLIDHFIRADPSEKISEFGELGLIELIVKKGVEEAAKTLPEGIRASEEAMAETIENNIRRLIVDEQPVNPKYYERMSELLDALIEERRQQAIDYRDYLARVKALSERVVEPEGSSDYRYPNSIDNRAKQALYDNLDQDEALAIRLDTAIRYTKKDGWVGDWLKEKEVKYVIQRELGEEQEHKADEILKLVKKQNEYK